MHGKEGIVIKFGNNSKRAQQHMRPVPSKEAASVGLGLLTVKVGVGVGVTGGGDFCPSSPSVKDLRKLNVGDCALFKPPQDTAPFIGIIRSLSSDKDSSQLLVNWLYRPADVELLNGALEAAPNEVFYSFHSDEVSAASLLHPCKVAFLPKGVELPSGLSSFVCRRVYDTTSKRLWWLTDRDYLNVRQEEVDKLLRKTQSEMHATVQQQQGGRSPKPVGSPMSASQLNHSPDSVQNSATTFPSHSKGKKRERSDQVSEPSKRERSSKADDRDSGFVRSESSLKAEIAKFTDKGGLVDAEGVERLVQLMHPDKSERRVDISCRSLLTGVIASTDKVDCLNRFVQLRGLPVLDEWLQEVHKGKVGDSSSPRDQDRLEEFLLVLLRALDRLPVNLNALQTCNIGKSVNHLRSHRNSDIQKKARTLVDTWKKRVEAEMSINDAKSGSNQAISWPARSRHDVAQGGNRHTTASSDAAMKNSVSQHPSSKSASVKLTQGEVVGKAVSASATPGIVKSASSPVSTSGNFRDGNNRVSAVSSGSELPQSTARDEKSSSSSQSHTNSQCSSDHVKNTGPSAKEDARSSNSGSTSLNKSSGAGSRHRRSPNGLQTSAAPVAQKECGSNRNSPMARVTAVEKLSQPPATCEKVAEAPVPDTNNHKLIVKISNRGRSPAQTVNGGVADDPSSINSRASSPVPDKHAQSDRSSKNHVTPDVNTESWQSNDLKDGVPVSDEGDGSPAAVADFGRQSGDDAGKITDAAKVNSTLKNETKSRKPLDSSLSPINALIESCVKYSGINSIPPGDDVGMNLLASVAAGEITKSGGPSPSHSSQRSASVADDTCRENNVTSRPHIDGEVSAQDHKATDAVNCEVQKQKISTGTSPGIKEVCGNEPAVSGKVLPHNADSGSRSEGKLGQVGKMSSVSSSPASAAGGVAVERVQECKTSNEDSDHVRTTDKRPGSATEGKGPIVSLKDEKHVKAAEVVPSDAVTAKNDVKHEPKSGDIAEQSPSVVVTKVEKQGATNLLTGSGSDRKSDNGDVDSCKLVNQVPHPKLEHEKDASSAPPKQEESSLKAPVTDQKLKSGDEDRVKIEAALKSPVTAGPEKELGLDGKSAKIVAAEGEGADERVSSSAATSSPAAGSSGMDGRLGFDLNEGFDDDSKDGDPPITVPPEGVSSVRLVSPVPSLSIASTAVSLPASITVAAAAKGPFLPPEDLLRNKGELGWKGSAATSAFRPAEPRKVPELHLSGFNAAAPDVSSSKAGRVRFEIDLNVADDMEDMGCQSFEPKADRRDEYGTTSGPVSSASMRSFGGLDLDLNRVDEAPDMGHPLPSNHKFEIPHQPARLSSSSGPSNSESARRDFDLNNGPAADEAAVESSSYFQHGRANVPVQPPLGFRITSSEIGNNMNSWYHAGNTFPAMPMPAQLPDRDQPFPIVGAGVGPPRMLGGPTGTMPFNPDMYRGSVLSSSPAVPFPAASFQYPMFPFGTSYPLPASSLPGGSTAFMDLSSGGRLFPAVPSPLVGSAPAVGAHYPRPYVVSLSDVSNSVAVENNRKWGRQGLDLNAGPGGLDVEGRDESLPNPPRPMSAMGSLTLTDEQARMYQMAGSVLKRKEPEGGWDADRLGYKQQPSWQ